MNHHFPRHFAPNDNRRIFDGFDHMRVHRAWWRKANERLRWQPIAEYEAEVGDIVLGEPVLVRSERQWALAMPHDGGWARFTEGGSYPLSKFEPTEFAIPDLDDLKLLAQE